MKRIQRLSIFLGLSLLSLGGLSRVAQAFPQPSLALAPVNKVFVPQGFDDNDNAEVVLQGYFPNSCMKLGPIESYVNQDSQVIEIRPQVYIYDSVACIQVRVPFIQKVSLGQLRQGEWNIQVEGNAAVEALPLSVRKAVSAAPDDYLYAPVSEVVLLPEPRSEVQRIVVSGRWPDMPDGRCFELVRLENRLGPDNALVVLPIAELREQGSCSDSEKRQRAFAASVLLEQQLAPEALIHVRVLNGESLNKFYD